ncbi:MAG: enhanced serine sensitivity protein SseB C-terminal domain-containing protein [Lysinibacillus sp.]
MKNARADELIARFLQNQNLDTNAYEEVEIQELIFLFHHARNQLNTEPHQREWLEARMKEFLIRLKEKVKAADTLYVAYDRHTDYPYIDADGRVWFFSKEEYAADVADYFLQKFVLLEMRKISGEEIMRTIGLLHLLDLPVIVIDNGQYYIELKRDELLPPMDWSGTPDIQIPVTNPGLQYAMILFFQTMNARQHTPDKQKLLLTLEARMLDEIIGARYLVPMQLLKQEPSVPDEQGNTALRQGDRIQFAVLEGEENSTWLPAFTDWFEFEKVYDKALWSSNVATYEDLLALSSSMTGIVLNPQGIGFRINASNRTHIEKYRQERAESASSTFFEAATPEEKHAVLGEPTEYPVRMVESLQAFLKTQKNIKKAYLRQKLGEDEQSYVLIIDVEGQKEEIFSKIADVAAPHSNGMTLEIIEMDDWTEEAKDIKPFYKKKWFGLF